MKTLGLAFAFMLATAAPAVAGSWWVIIGSHPQEREDLMKPMAMEMSAKAGRCGYRPFNDFSGKFEGFRPGVNVFVVGDYKTRETALAHRQKLLACFPDAYVKEGRYMGE